MEIYISRTATDVHQSLFVFPHYYRIFIIECKENEIRLDYTIFCILIKNVNLIHIES